MDAFKRRGLRINLKRKADCAVNEDREPGHRSKLSARKPNSFYPKKQTLSPAPCTSDVLTPGPDTTHNPTPKQLTFIRIFTRRGALPTSFQ